MSGWNDDDVIVSDLRRRIEGLIQERDALSLRVETMEARIRKEWESRFNAVNEQNKELRKREAARRRSRSHVADYDSIVSALRRQLSEAQARFERVRDHLLRLTGGDLSRL